MKKIVTSFLVFFVFLLTLTSSVDAALVFEEKRGIVPVYNPNGGGLLASVTLIVNTRIDHNSPAVPNPDFRSVQMTVTTSTLRVSFDQCGGLMETNSPAKIGSTQIPLYKYTGDTIGDPRYAYRMADSNTHYILRGNQNVQVGGSFYPTLSNCSLGGPLNHNFSFNNN